MKIGILSTPPICTLYFKRLTLPGMFRDSEIVEVLPKHISPTGLKKLDLLILPGINGEDSPYPEILTDRKGRFIYDAMFSDGLVTWAECASVFHLTDTYSYLKSNGELKTRKGLGLIPGTAAGPAFPREYFPDRNVVANIFNKESFLTYQAYDINGPALYPDLSHQTYDTIYRYRNAPDEPVCGIIKSIGKGLLAAFSFHASIPFTHPSIPDNRITDQDRIQEGNRLLFLDHLGNLFRSHLTNLKLERS